MTVLIWLVLAVFGVALFLIAGALVELYRSLEQVRAQAGAMDALTRLEVGSDSTTLQSSGMPAELFEEDRSLLLVLSDRCSTCETLAERLAGGPPAGSWILLQPHSGESGSAWLKEYAFQDSPNVVVDAEESITDLLDIRISPAVLRFRTGELVAAHTVPSPRRLAEELRWLRKGGTDTPEYNQAHETFEAVSRITSAAG